MNRKKRGAPQQASVNIWSYHAGARGPLASHLQPSPMGSISLCSNIFCLWTSALTYLEMGSKTLLFPFFKDTTKWICHKTKGTFFFFSFQHICLLAKNLSGIILFRIVSYFLLYLIFLCILAVTLAFLHLLLQKTILYVLTTTNIEGTILWCVKEMQNLIYDNFRIIFSTSVDLQI